jgi:hypothetical protein
MSPMYTLSMPTYSPLRHHRILHSFLVLGSVLMLASKGQSQALELAPDGTVPRVQLTGEDFQIYSHGNLFSAPTLSRTMSRYGVLGSDLGFPVTYPDKILLLFGDTMAAYPVKQGGGEKFVFEHEARGNDSIGYIPNSDLSKCNYIAEVDKKMSEGNKNPNVSPDGCPELRFYTNPHHSGKEHAFMTTTISGLESDENLGAFGTPSGAFSQGGRLYMFYIVKNQEAKPHFALRSILARSDQPDTSWSDSKPPKFTRLYAVSNHPKIEDPGNPPAEADAAGKFMFNPLVVMSSDDIQAAGFAQGLPPALQKASRVVFVFGSSWRYNRSNLYLAAFSADDVEAGTSKWFYFSGQPGGATNWASDEVAATPMFADDPRIGNHSVVWNKSLHRFVLMYGNIITRFGATPWGPWGRPIPVFLPKSDWAQKLIHHPDGDPIARTVAPVYGPRLAKTLDLNKSEPGVPYGPFLLDRSTQNADGSVTVYYLMSTWNPYQVFLVSSTFRKVS